MEHVAVQLSSVESSGRPIIKHELEVLIGQYAQYHVQLLPVFLRLKEVVQPSGQKMSCLLSTGVLLVVPRTVHVSCAFATGFCGSIIPAMLTGCV